MSLDSNKLQKARNIKRQLEVWTLEFDTKKLFICLVNNSMKLFFNIFNLTYETNYTLNDISRICLRIICERQKWKYEGCECESCLLTSDCVTPWIIQSMEFSRPEYWSG